MKIRISELRKIIREEIARSLNENDGSPEDAEAYERIMALITGALGDSPEAKKLGMELRVAMATQGDQPVNVSKTPTQRPPGGVAPPARTPTMRPQSGVAPEASPRR